MGRTGICAECGFDWDSNAEDVLSEIESAAVSYSIELDRIDAEELRQRPDESIWSPIEYAGHVRDVAAFYCDRIERIATRDRPRLDVARFPAMVEARRGLREDPRSVLAALQAHLATTATQLARLGSREWHRVGIGSEGDERTVLDLARRLAHELRHHQGDLGHPRT